VSRIHMEKKNVKIADKCVTRKSTQKNHGSFGVMNPTNWFGHTE